MCVCVVQLLSQPNVIALQSSAAPAAVTISPAQPPAAVAAAVPAGSSSIPAAAPVNGKLPIARLTTSTTTHKPAKTLAKLLPQNAAACCMVGGAREAELGGLEAELAILEAEPGQDDGQVEAGGVRSSHNIVEKRYRMSINDKLGELRELVDGRDSKVCIAAVSALVV